jgi:AbrB family looped-hinge helix DNA binding protein
MSTTVEEELDKPCDTRSVGSKGEVTLLKEWREERGLEPGDTVWMSEQDDGTLKIVGPDRR